MILKVDRSTFNEDRAGTPILRFIEKYSKNDFSEAQQQPVVESSSGLKVISKLRKRP